MGAEFATDPLDNPLWQYACEIYQRPNVASILLELQDQQHTDVLLWLSALWLTQTHSAPCDLSKTARFEYQRWQTDVIQPLRHIRKTPWVAKQRAIKTQIQHLEITAEQHALGLLYSHLHHDAGRAPNALSPIFPETCWTHYRTLSGMPANKKEALWPLLKRLTDALH